MALNGWVMIARLCAWPIQGGEPMGKGCRGESSADKCRLVLVELVDNLWGLGLSWMLFGRFNEEFTLVSCWSLNMRSMVFRWLLKAQSIRCRYFLRSIKRMLTTRELSLTGNEVSHKKFDSWEVKNSLGRFHQQCVRWPRRLVSGWSCYLDDFWR